MDNYLRVMEESLIKKSEVLDEILVCSKKQEELLKEERLSLEGFDSIVEQKDSYVDQLSKLDDGFETLYNRVSNELNENRSKHAEDISRMQKVIADITTKSVEIQALEIRNKVALEQAIRKERATLKMNRQSSKAAYDYYKNMNQGNISVARYMDQKN